MPSAATAADAIAAAVQLSASIDIYVSPLVAPLDLRLLSSISAKQVQVANTV